MIQIDYRRLHKTLFVKFVIEQGIPYLKTFQLFIDKMRGIFICIHPTQTRFIRNMEKETFFHVIDFQIFFKCF